VFIRYYVELPVPFEQAEDLLLRSPGRWIPGLAEGADAKGQRLLTEVGFGRPGRRVDKRVEITLEEPMRFATKTVLPLSWRATGPERLFPDLEADLAIASLGPGRSHLAIDARYRPPLGAPGSVLDRALLHRVAEATLKDFLDRIAAVVKDSFARSVAC
jgi:hypothetical protein